MRVRSLLLASFVTISCTVTHGPSSVDVRHWGTLVAVHRGGDTSAKIALADVLPGPHCYAVGALSGMRGEITVLDDQAWISLPVTTDGERRLSTSCTATSTESAALLVAANVTKWKRVTVAEDVTAENFDAWLGDVARKEEIDVTKPFPFVITGGLRDLSFHVVDGSRLTDTGSPEEFHEYTGVREHSAAIDGTLVGFYSTTAQGVFVHHDSFTHVHVVVESPGMTGHVDAVTVAKGAMLQLPIE